MKIYTNGGYLAYKTFRFPDGQPHFELLTHDKADSATIEARITNVEELVNIILAGSVLIENWYGTVNLDIRYMLGARMDRAIGASSPETLRIFAGMINQVSWNRIRVLDPHSVWTEEFLDAYPVLPHGVVRNIIDTLGSPANLVLVSPDKGATGRVQQLTPSDYQIIRCLKHRDSATGKLSHFEITNPEDIQGRSCLIVDDICDGGRTFTGIAELLKKAGALRVYLYVTHGIFSAGHNLQGIDKVFTTDSYHNWNVPFGPVCIPISMKDLK